MVGRNTRRSSYRSGGPLPEPPVSSSTAELCRSRDTITSFEIEPYTSTLSGLDGSKSDKTFVEKYGGMLMALLASIFFSASFLIVKILGMHGFSANGTAVLFNLGVIIPAIPAMIFHEYGPGWKGRKRISADVWPLNTSVKWKMLGILFLQGALQGLSVLLRSQSLKFISVGDMTVIVFSSPVLVTIIAHFVLKEKCALWPIIVAFMTLAGVVLIMKPPILTGNASFDNKTLTGSTFAIGALFSLSMKFVVTRSIKEANFLTMTIFLGGCGLLISLPLFLVLEDYQSIVPKTAEDAWLVAGLLMAFCSIASINLALKMENAGPVALVRSCDVIFAFLLQYIFLDVVPDLLSGIGTLLVVLGVLITAAIRWLRDLPEMNSFRKNLSCCLR